MNRLWIIALLIVGSVSAFSATDGDRFHRLDSLIAARPQIVDIKETRLAEMKSDLARETTGAGRYAALKRLYEEYSAYQYDSAFTYVSECQHLAQSMGDKRLENESRLNLAHILSTACLMDKAQQVLNEIDTLLLTADQLI